MRLYRAADGGIQNEGHVPFLGMVLRARDKRIDHPTVVVVDWDARYVYVVPFRSRRVTYKQRVVGKVTLRRLRVDRMWRDWQPA